MAIRSRSFIYFFVLLILILGSYAGTQLIPRPVLPPPMSYLPPPLALKNLAVGMQYQIADSLWIRSMGDLDYCEKLINSRDCVGKSWLFRVFDLATTLDPVFEPVLYQVAGLALTVIISDYAGASVIFDRGVEKHPTYWHLTYAAAYHAHFEEINYIKAGKLYSLAGRHGAPTWVGTMAGRLAAEGGDLILAEQILGTMIEMNIEEKYIERLKKKLDEVKKRTN